jgi:hypothetical protein
MRTWIKTAAATSVALAVVGGGVWVASAAGSRVASAAGSKSATSAYTIRLTAVQTNSRTFFTGPHGSPQPGDHFVFQQRLFYDAQRHDPAGTAFISCTFDFAASTACHANAVLNHRGQLVVDGLGGNAANFTIAIVGGTGEFTNVGGTAEVLNPGHTVQTLVLHIQS